MEIKPEELVANNYTLLASLEHHNIIPFVRTYIKKKTRFATIYYISNIIPLLLLFFFSYKYYNTPGFTIINCINHFCYGLAIAIALVPLHEYIHVLAYKSQGAKQTSYDSNIKKFYFMAIADQFVANRKEFQIVALAPFVCISSVLIVLLFFAAPSWNYTIIGILFTHTACCSGDFTLLSFFDFHKDKTVVTYDDKKNKISYFFEK
ncbi:DUF3267 domain-containing protein [Ferruginibacter sp. SUN106]|uniref:DUF3267 domain-containing protein n=1 Tax=Ferruginibacter sp. SUN106 TaxID=2978348 RepID=UPI003D35B14F